MPASNGPGAVLDAADPPAWDTGFGSGVSRYDDGFTGQLSSFLGYTAGVARANGFPGTRPTVGVQVPTGPEVQLHRGPHGFVGEVNPGSGRTVYDAGYPETPVNALVSSHGDTNILTGSQQDVPYPDVNIRRYIDTSTGGRTGVANKMGYSSGLRRWWNGGPGGGVFTGRTKRFVTRDLAKDTGPVGRSNYAGQLQSAVASQYHVPPSLESIYRSLTGMSPLEDADNG